MRKILLVHLALCLFSLSLSSSANNRHAYGQGKSEQRLCPDIPGRTSATHRFRRHGETIEISIRGEGVPASLADCEPVSLELEWANGRNNGSNFTVIFRDSNSRPIFRKSVVGFRTGLAQFPLSSFDTHVVRGSSMGMISVPATVSIQAASPFAAPASLSYRVVRMHRASKEPKTAGAEVIASSEREGNGNEVVSINRAMRLIGASRLPLVQIELRTNRPFPVSDVPLRLQIGNRIFLDELSGDYTGRKLTLSLTHEMYADLREGEEILAFFGEPNSDAARQDVWRFGKLSKPILQ